MAITLSNRETFIVLDWLQGDPARLRRLRERAAASGAGLAVHQLSETIYQEVRADLPQMQGLGALILETAIRRINFYELALAVLNEEQDPPSGPAEGSTPPV